MSGLLALLDDVAAITKLAASQLDDISAQAIKASSKAAGVVIDDAAVTPKYVTGLPATRELPIIWKIARQSLINKVLILTPLALLLNLFAPWALTPLLMVGGAYLCFEGAEKVLHALFGGHEHVHEVRAVKNAGHLEEIRVKGAIKTDFILSAEIMAIALSTLETELVWQQGVILAIVGTIITVAVYGAVAILVRADDWGLILQNKGGVAIARAVGTAIVTSVPYVLKALSVIGTAAMLWVGGNILVHGAYQLGWKQPEVLIKSLAAAATGAVGFASGFINWLGIAALDAVVGIVVGSVLVMCLGLFTRSDKHAPPISTVTR